MPVFYNNGNIWEPDSLILDGYVYTCTSASLGDWFESTSISIERAGETPLNNL